MVSHLYIILKLILSFLGTDTAKNTSELLDKCLIDTLNKAIGSKSNDNKIDLLEIDLNHLIKNCFLELDKHLKDLINDQSGSVAVRKLS